MNIIVHYPKNDVSKKELEKRVADIHVESILAIMKNRDYSVEEQKDILGNLEESCRL